MATPPAGAGHSRTVRAGQDRPTTRRRRPPLWWLGAAGILAGVLLAVSGGLVPGLALALGGGILCAVAR